MEKIKVFLIARTRNLYNERNEKLCAMLDEIFSVYMPQNEIPASTSDDHKKLSVDFTDPCMITLMIQI